MTELADTEYTIYIYPRDNQELYSYGFAKNLRPPCIVVAELSAYMGSQVYSSPYIPV